MRDLLADPRNLLILGCIVGLVIVINLPLLGLLRGRTNVHREIGQWRRLVRDGKESVGRDSRRIDELHQRVAGLKREPPAAESTADDDDQGGA